jgi:integrase
MSPWLTPSGIRNVPLAHPRKLIQGKGSLTISQLMGHANGSMLARVYGHLDKNVDFL